MIIPVTMRRLVLCIFLLLCMAIISTGKPQANREDECYYYYIQQPSSNVSCNPWPYIENYSGNALVLHCDLLSPQNNDIPNVEWYRSLYNDISSKRQRIHYGSRKRKFSTPISSGDISSGFKRINFTLFVNDVSEADAGCYWCEISAGKCSFHMQRSSEFCLHKASAYRDRESCPILPVNSSVVCAADTVCDELPANWLGDPYLIIDDITTRSGGPTQAPSPSQPMVPAHIPPAVLTDIHVSTVSPAAYGSNSIISSLSSLHTRQRPPITFTTPSIQPITSSNYYQHGSVTSEASLTSTPTISLTSHIPPQITPAADYYRTKIANLLPLSSIHISKSVDSKRATVVSSSSVMVAGSGMQSNSTIEKELPLHLTLVQISVFVGIGVCTVLFAVISILVFGVVMLCRKTTPTTPARTNHIYHEGEGHHILSNSPAELISTVMRRELEASPVPMTVVNTEHSLLPPSSVPSFSSIRAAVTNEDDGNLSHHTQDQQQTSPTMISLPVTSPMTSVPMPTLPFHMNAEFRWRAYSLPLLTERTDTINHVNQLKQNQHHPSLEGNRESMPDYQQIDVSNAASVSSPELHYYHVLERPEYYNCIWLEGEDGHELLLGQAKRSNRQRVTIKEDDSESDSEYHWKVVLTSSGGQKEDGRDLDRSFSSKRVGRHLYRRLDHSTLEPLQDYAKVSIASSNHDFDGSHIHSQ